jgi:pimeloyl-ACP methyl ester carboxylesterase
MKKLILLPLGLSTIGTVQHLSDRPEAVLIRSNNSFHESGPVVKRITLITGVELEYAEQGNADGLPVIFLHGITDSWKSFLPIMPLLPTSLHVFALSQRGHGNSSKPVTNYLPENFAADVSEFIRAKGLKAPVIVGHSMGSTNAQSFAAMYPQQAKAVVLMGAFADYNKPTMTGFKSVIEGLNDPIDTTFIADFQKSTLTKPIDADLLQTFIDESGKVPAHVWKGVAAGWPSATFLQALSSFQKPALIIWGDRDTYATYEDQVKLKSALHNATFLKYEGIGHASHWEDPERFTRDLVNFIQTHQLHN